MLIYCSYYTTDSFNQVTFLLISVKLFWFLAVFNSLPLYLLNCFSKNSPPSWPNNFPFLWSQFAKAALWGMNSKTHGRKGQRSCVMVWIFLKEVSECGYVASLKWNKWFTATNWLCQFSQCLYLAQLPAARRDLCCSGC